jgi:ATP-dependent Clp protease adaptor protein ClpS
VARPAARWIVDVSSRPAGARTEVAGTVQGVVVAVKGELVAGSAPTPVREVETEEQVDLDLPWDVVVWDDPVNLMSYVVFVFRRVFGFPESVARKLMLEVHESGSALVASEPREQAQRYVKELHSYGLHATMQRSA